MTQPVKEYESYVDFTNDFIITVMQEGYAVAVVDYHDYYGLIGSLQEKTICGKSLYLDYDTIENFDSDIELAKSRDGLIMVTVHDDAGITGEAVLFNHPEAYIEASYFVEKDAQSFLTKPISGNLVLFEIKKDKIET